MKTPKKSKVIIKNITSDVSFTVPYPDGIVGRICEFLTGTREVNKYNGHGKLVAAHEQSINNRLQFAAYMLHQTKRAVIKYDIDVNGTLCNIKVVG